MKKSNKALLICIFCVSIALWSCKKDSSDGTVAPTQSVVTASGQSTTTGPVVHTDAVPNLQLWGLGSTLQAELSLNKTYSWYIDQYTTGTYWSVNCGPTSTTMSIKWADPTFSKTPLDARNTYRSTGGWWYTTDVVNYLTKYGINWRYTSLPDEYQTMLSYLGKGEILILCLDNYYLTYNSNSVQHVGKYYTVSGAGSGHFIVIKGYKIVDSKVYFEAYDPWSIGATYADGSGLKGQDRYYTSANLSQATTIWWDYAIIIAPKGKQVTAIAGLKTFALPTQVPEQKGR
jgi:hypothetical protein